ncbi:TetR/AcrR family transcriptional regulator [Cupriavidus pauculus]|uniref:TetR/AcrR family transcriptional regulator n=1 Tax=Cupriavidus pauculus TaxID=82633 RepID=UPI001FD44DE4|nr:TetR/AcrR family transcriptional regulator [Cupriavidus pauculus]
MTSLYRRRTATGFGNTNGDAEPSEGCAKPLKRPSQARARFTVQAIYDAFVRIWRRDGPAAATTRAVALEAGYSVGTLYEYFPNRDALLSGYVRHIVETMLARIRAEVTEATALSWRARVSHLVRLTCCDPDLQLPYFDLAMLESEDRIAEPKHHRRVFDEFCRAWQVALDACPDLPAPATAETVQTLVMAVWGARRYRLLLPESPPANDAWIDTMIGICLHALAAPDASDASDASEAGAR